MTAIRSLACEQGARAMNIPPELYTWGVILVQLLLATVCGGLIGYQREILDRPAGFRTHVLVCVGSAVYMLVSVIVAGDRFDPGRIAAQVASGMGFLGAGTIIKQGSVVRGLTTAASMWAVAGIGLAVGYGGTALAVAVMATGVVYLALGFLKKVELRIGHSFAALLTLALPSPRERVSQVTEVLDAHAIELSGFTIEGEHEPVGRLALQIRVPSRQELQRAVRELTADRSITSVHWDMR